MSFDRGMEDGYYGGYSERLYNRDDSYREGFDYGRSMAEDDYRASERHAAEEQAYAEYCEELEAEHWAEVAYDMALEGAWVDDGGAVCAEVCF